MAKKNLMDRHDEILNYIKLGASKTEIMNFLEITEVSFTALIEKMSKKRYGRHMYYSEFVEKIAFEEKMGFKSTLISFAKKTQSPEFRWKIWNEFYNEPEKQTEEVAKVVVQDLSKVEGCDIIKIGRAIELGVNKKIDRAISKDQQLK